MKSSDNEWLQPIQNCWGQDNDLCMQTESIMYLVQCNTAGSSIRETSSTLPALYHVTPSVNIDSILRNGLIPQIGDRSKAAAEKKPAIYFFCSKEDMEQALWNWLGEEFEDVEITVLIVCLPNKYLDALTPKEFEVRCEKSIPAQYIQFLDRWENQK